MTEAKIDNFSFGPAALTVAVGSTVTWINPRQNQDRRSMKVSGEAHQKE